MVTQGGADGGRSHGGGRADDSRGPTGARSHGGATGSTGRGGVLDSEAGGGDRGSSSHGADGDWQTCSLVAGIVAGSRTWSDVTCSIGSAAIISSVTPCGDGSSVTVGSGLGSAQRGDGGLAVLWIGAGCSPDTG